MERDQDGHHRQNSSRHLEGSGAKPAGLPIPKTFRTKRDVEDWSRRTEDEMVRGVYIQRSSERMTFVMALKHYLAEISSTKKPTTQRAEATKAQQLISHLGKYSMAALFAEIIANYHDTRLASITNRGKPTSHNTVRLELALHARAYLAKLLLSREPRAHHRASSDHCCGASLTWDAVKRSVTTAHASSESS